MKEFVERFEARSKCRQVVFDYAYYFLFGEYPSIRDNIKCKSISGIYHFFVKKNILVRCRCSKIFLLNPILAYIVLKSNLMTKNRKPKKRVAIITFSSAMELYGIEDLWTHYICETINNKKYRIYDPYYQYIFEDYKIKIPKLNKTRISNAKKFQLYLWIN